MEDNNDLIPIGQMIFILMLTIVGAGILTLPRDLAVMVESDHWIILLVGGFIALVAVLVHGAIIRLKPRKHYFDILCDALTKPIAYLVGFAYVIYLIIAVGSIVRIFGDGIKMYLLANTPIEVINISMLVTCVYLARKGIEVLGRMLQFLVPILIVLSTFIICLTLTKSDFTNLLPVFQITFQDILKGIPTTVLSFAGFEVLLFFGVFLDKPKKATWGSIAIIVVLIYYISILIATLAQFGPIQMKYLLWPTLDLFDTIELPGLFIENVQVILMSLWVLFTFSSMAPTYLASVVMVKSLTGSRDQAYLAAPLLPFIYFASIIPENIAEAYKIIGIYSKYFASTMTFGIPIIVLVSLVIQKKLGKETGANA